MYNDDKEKEVSRCLTGLKMDVVVERVCQVVAEEAPIPGVAQRVALAEGKVVARVKEQGESDSLNVARGLGSINAINDKNHRLLLLRAQKRGRGFEPPTPSYFPFFNF